MPLKRSVSERPSSRIRVKREEMLSLITPMREQFGMKPMEIRRRSGMRLTEFRYLVLSGGCVEEKKINKLRKLYEDLMSGKTKSRPRRWRKKCIRHKISK